LSSGQVFAQPPLTTTLPPITVTAQKEPEDPQTLPVSVTAVLSDTLTRAALRTVSEAGWFAPNIFFNEFTARKLSNPRIRGIGASPTNPGVTSYIDGVPQLNANSSSIEFIGVDQVEFVRGPQSALFGRNALRGVINITSARPSLQTWSGERARDGDYALNDLGSLRARPLHAARDVEGFTHRDILAPTVQIAYAGTAIDVATTTGFLKWKTDDLTDLDYTPLPLITRSN